MQKATSKMKHPIIMSFGPVDLNLFFEDDEDQRVALTDEELTKIGQGIATALDGIDIRSAHTILHQFLDPMCAMASGQMEGMIHYAMAMAGEDGPEGDSPEGSDENAKPKIPKHLH